MNATRLFNDNRALVNRPVTRYAKLCPAWQDRDDVEQIALLGLWDAAKSYVDSMGAFSTYALKCILNRLYKAFAQRWRAAKRGFGREVPFSSTEGADNLQYANLFGRDDAALSKLERREEIDAILRSMNPKHADILRGVFLDGWTWDAAAEKHGYTSGKTCQVCVMNAAWDLFRSDE